MAINRSDSDVRGGVFATAHFKRLPPRVGALLFFASLCLNPLNAQEQAFSDSPRLAEDDVIYDAESILTLNPKWSLMRCSGDSMAPLLCENDIIVVQKDCFDQLYPGMVLVFRNEAGKPIVHRALAKESGKFVTGGIANIGPDHQRVDAANFIGVVIAVFHQENRRVSSFGAEAFEALPVAYCDTK